MFVHLHLHSDFSLLDGVAQIHQIVARLEELNFKAAALTDHGNMYGIPKFYSALKKKEIKPILGMEAYISPRDHKLKEHGVDNKYSHLTILAKNFVGYKNLIKLTSIAHIEGLYYKPRVSMETLLKYKEGLIILSGCLGGVVPKIIREHGDGKQLQDTLDMFQEEFKEDFYIEIQRNKIEEQLHINEILLRESKKRNIPAVATVDSHYIKQEDYILQEVLWCIRDGKLLTDPTRATYSSQEFYIKSEEEMLELYSDMPELVHESGRIAEKVEDYSIQFKRVEPVFNKLPEGVSAKAQLEKLAYEGLKEKYRPEEQDTARERIKYELDVINDKGYNDYFLIVGDFIDFCRKNNIQVGIRGSACGSAVSYAIGITHVEPIKWELYFERFLNPSRPSPPDIDIDIADSRRDEVIKYTVEQFGDANVKKIITFNKLQTRQAIRDISRVMGLPLVLAGKLSKMVKVDAGKVKDIQYMMDNDEEFKKIIESDPKLLKMKDIVQKLNGVHRGVGTHACGIVITPEPVVEYVPIQPDSQGTGMGMTQYEMGDLEDAGLMKFDFLGLKNLAVIGDTIDIVSRTQNKQIDILNVDFRDKKTYETLRLGHTVGVFQLESDGIRRILKELKPTSLEDISFLLAAYRPGPLEFIPQYIDVKNGIKKAEYLFPELEPILKVTNGVIAYQEQIMRIAVDLAGYSMKEVDNLRKGIGKKKMEILEVEKPKFISGMVANNIKQELAEELWETFLRWGKYGFNKAHSASYSYVTYWTAYLKTNYPLEYMIALIKNDLDKFDKVIKDLEDCKRMGIKILPPDVNSSVLEFTVAGKNRFRFGLKAIKNVGEDLLVKLIEEREKGGKFKSIEDFVNRLHKAGNSRSFEALAKAGAFDSLEDRNTVISKILPLYQSVSNQKHNTAEQISFFESVPIEYKIQNNSEFQLLQWEKELLGLYLSKHPISMLEDFLSDKKVTKINKIKDLNDGDLVILAGYIEKVKRIITKNHTLMSILKVSDDTGDIEVVLFPKKYEEFKGEITDTDPILVAGRLQIKKIESGHEDNPDESEEEVKIYSISAVKIKRIDTLKHQSQKSRQPLKVLKLHITDALDETEISNIKKIIKEREGMGVQIQFFVDRAGIKRNIILESEIKDSPDLYNLFSKYLLKDDSID